MNLTKPPIQTTSGFRSTVLISLVLLASACAASLWGFSFGSSPDFLKPPATLNEPQNPDGPFLIDGRETNIDRKIQAHLQQYLKNKANPVAAAMVVEVSTGKVIAMVQGRKPKEWDSTSHTALYAGFPAASLFKTVVAAAAMEVAGLEANQATGLWGSCGKVHRSASWLRNARGRARKMTLSRAYGQSCNSYFAKLALTDLGLHSIKTFAERFGWKGQIQTDFAVMKSPFHPPSVSSASVYSVGRFAAGFGNVGISAAHAAWLTLALANNGVSKPLRLLPESENSKQFQPQRLVSPLTAEKMREIMKSTIQGGTASFAFRRGKTRRLRYEVGGKTGTLTGHAPHGVSTWFAGMMPLDDPQVVVAAIVVLEDLWHIKGPNLAAEAFWAYRKFRESRERIASGDRGIAH